MDLIVIAGAPGVGKLTLGLALARSLGSPFLEFSMLRQPHLDPTWSNASPTEHEMAWESLQFIVRNYKKYGFKNVVVTDSRDNRFQQVPAVFCDLEYRIVTLAITDEMELWRPGYAPDGRERRSHQPHSRLMWWRGSADGCATW